MNREIAGVEGADGRGNSEISKWMEMETGRYRVSGK